jgi:hypothetical protein
MQKSAVSYNTVKKNTKLRAFITEVTDEELKEEEKSG